MEHYRLRKYRSAETWARVREAYVAGESGPSVARRFDVGLANLRKKAAREGWHRRATAMLLERELPARREGLPPGLADGGGVEAGVEDEAPDLDPDTAIDQLMRRAIAAAGQGRAAEAQGLIRAAEGLKRLTQPAHAPGERPLTPEECDARAAAEEVEAAAVRERVVERLSRLAEHMAHELLMQQPSGIPAVYMPFVYVFRARHFGPEIEAADHRHAAAMGWSLDHWDADGRLKPGLALGPSGHAPASTTAPSEGAGPEHCCAWTEEMEAAAREGRGLDDGEGEEG